MASETVAWYINERRPKATGSLSKNSPTTKEKSFQLQAYRQFKDEVGPCAWSKACICLQRFGLCIVRIIGPLMMTRYMKKGLAGNRDQYSIKSYIDGQAAMKMQASSP